MKELKEKLKYGRKGITLIALVITIIVLLILAGVSIATLTGENGILTRANDAKNQTEEAEEIEKIKLAVPEAKMEETGLNTDTLKKAINNYISQNSIIEDELDGWYVLTNGNGYSITKDGEVIKTDWIKNEEGKIQNIVGNITLEIGDYVNYNPTIDENGNTISKNYIAPIGTYVEDTSGQDGKMEKGTGYVETQEFTLETNTKWRVLGLENGKIKLISADTSNKKLALRGQTGYQWGIDIINEISEIYGYGAGADYARGLTVEDINKITGYNPENQGDGSVYGNGGVATYGNNMTYTKNIDDGFLSLKGTIFPTTLTNTNQKLFRFFDGSTWKSLRNGENYTYKSTGYMYYPTTLTNSTTGDVVGIIENSPEYSTICGLNSIGKFWLASQSITTSVNSSYLEIRGVNSLGSINLNRLYFTNGETRQNTEYGIRPVVLLQSNIKLEIDENAEHSWLID